MSKKENYVYGLILFFIVLAFYELIRILLPIGFVWLLPIMILASDFALKTFFVKQSVNYNALPYLTLPFPKKMLIKTILLLNVISVWNLYCCIGISVLLHADFFLKSESNILLSSINIYLLFVFNSYFALFFKTFINAFLYLLLFPIFLFLMLPVYLLCHSSILGTLIILTMIIIILYINTCFIIDKINKQLDEISF
jgi:hypothetical protein